MLDPTKAACLVGVAEATGTIIRSLFLLLDGGITEEQAEGINESIQEFADVEKNLILRLRKAFE